MLIALLTFHDANETHRSSDSIPPPPLPPKTVPSPATSVSRTLPSSNTPPPPSPPPRPAPKTGVERIVEMQAIKGDYNEIIISDEGSVQDYAEYCNNLLQVCAAN